MPGVLLGERNQLGVEAGKNIETQFIIIIVVCFVFVIKRENLAWALRTYGR
jgi:hypothetical protein